MNAMKLSCDIDYVIEDCGPARAYDGIRHVAYSMIPIPNLFLMPFVERAAKKFGTDIRKIILLMLWWHLKYRYVSFMEMQIRQWMYTVQKKSFRHPPINNHESRFSMEEDMHTAFVIMVDMKLW